MCLCINVLIQHLYDRVSFNDTLPHTLVSWHPLSIMAQSFQMLFYMWEGNKMFCVTSQVFLKQFRMLIIQYTAWNQMDAASYDELESYALKLKSCGWKYQFTIFLSDLPRFKCRQRDHCSLRKRTQCNLYVFPSRRNPLRAGSSRQLSVCKGVAVVFHFDLNSRWSNSTPLHPDPSPALPSTLAWMLHYLRTCI